MRGNPFLTLILLVTLMLIPVGISAQSSATVIINEILPDAAGSDSGKEWIEIYNYSDSSTTLTGYYLKLESSSGSSKTITIPTITLSARSYFIVSEFDLGSGNFINIGSGKIAMYNSASKIFLYDSTNTKIDELSYTTPGENLTFERRGATCVELFSNSAGGTVGAQNTNYDSSCFPVVTVTPPISFPPTIPPAPINYKLQISEIYPSPDTGEEEWLELYNSDSKDIDLTNFWLQKPSTSTKTNLQGIISANSYKLISSDELKFALNNSGDEIMLFSKESVKLDSLKYKSTSKGFSVGKTFRGSSYTNDTEYSQTTLNPTPLGQNIFPDNSIYEISSIENLKLQSVNKKYAFTGNVSVDTSLTKSQAIYLNDGFAGIKVKNSNSQDFVAGNHLKVIGNLVKTDSEIYIEDISIELLEGNKVQDFKSLNTVDDFNKSFLMNVAFAGEVTNNYSTTFDVNFAGASVRINKLQDITITKGQKYSIKGFLYKDGILNRLIALEIIPEGSLISTDKSKSSSTKTSLLDGIILPSSEISQAEQRPISTKVNYLSESEVLGLNSSIKPAPPNIFPFFILIIQLILCCILCLTFIDIKYWNLWKSKLIKLIFWVKNIKLQSLKDYF